MAYQLVRLRPTEPRPLALVDSYSGTLSLCSYDLSSSCTAPGADTNCSSRIILLPARPSRRAECEHSILSYGCPAAFRSSSPTSVFVTVAAPATRTALPNPGRMHPSTTNGTPRVLSAAV